MNVIAAGQLPGPMAPQAQPRFSMTRERAIFIGKVALFILATFAISAAIFAASAFAGVVVIVGLSQLCHHFILYAAAKSIALIASQIIGGAVVGGCSLLLFGYGGFPLLAATASFLDRWSSPRWTGHALGGAAHEGTPQNRRIDITCNQEQLMRDPESYFNQLVAGIDRGNTHLSVRFENSHAADHGGPSRAFVLLLFRSLINRDFFKLHDLGGKRLPYLPLINESPFEGESAERLRKLGRVLGFLVRARIPIGEWFHSEFFSAICQIRLNGTVALQPEHFFACLKNASRESFLPYFAHARFIDENRVLFCQANTLNEVPTNVLQNINAAGYHCNETNFAAVQAEVWEELRQRLIEVFFASYLIAREINVARHRLPKLERDLQGRALTKDSFISAFRLDWAPSFVGGELRSWVHKESTTLDHLRAVLFAMTGTHALQGNLVIQLQQECRTFEYHTCASFLEIPPQCTAEEFRTELENISTAHLPSFNTI